MRCEICHAAEATVHLCQVHHDVGKQAQQQTATHEYCEACFRKQASTSQDEVPSFTGTECCYHCRGPAESGSANIGPALSARQQQWHWTCHRCFRIESTFLLEELSNIDRGLSEAEAYKAVEDVIRRADAHVQQSVRRDSE